MRLRTCLVAIVLLLGFAACGSGKTYKKFLKAAKELVCDNENIIKQLETDPGNPGLNLKLKSNNGWIDFYAEKSGNPERFRKELIEHSCQ